jgi:hypothetical protein
MILLDILTFPFTAPVNGTIWVIEQLRDRALAAVSDPEQLRADLIQLRINYERGTISEEEYSQQSEVIWERLKLVAADSGGDTDGNDADEE